MVKAILSTIIVALLLIGGAFYETTFVNRQFNELNEIITELYEKTDAHTAVEDDVVAVKCSWTDKKRWLHAFIPHNEIKEVDLWISETITLVRDKEWADATSKLKVLMELSKEIPKNFMISIENIL